MSCCGDCRRSPARSTCGEGEPRRSRIRRSVETRSMRWLEAHAPGWRRPVLDLAAPSERASPASSRRIRDQLEFLDNMNERAADAGQANGRQLHLALAEALNPESRSPTTTASTLGVTMVDIYERSWRAVVSNVRFCRVIRRSVSWRSGKPPVLRFLQSITNQMPAVVTPRSGSGRLGSFPIVRRRVGSS